jgi:periplasmic divalent cation tolerance protein
MVGISRVRRMTALQRESLMKAMDGFCTVMTATPDVTGGEALAAQIIDAQLAACVQMLPITSIYMWQGVRQRSAEVLLLIKTRQALYPALEAFIKAHHPYNTPEILLVPVLAGSAAYLQWMREQTARPEAGQA